MHAGATYLHVHICCSVILYLYPCVQSLTPTRLFSRCQGETASVVPVHDAMPALIAINHESNSVKYPNILEAIEKGGGEAIRFSAFIVRIYRQRMLIKKLEERYGLEACTFCCVVKVTCDSNIYSNEGTMYRGWTLGLCSSTNLGGSTDTLGGGLLFTSILKLHPSLHLTLKH